MPRKLNIGRQNEQLLNNDSYNLYLALKYINNGPQIPKKDTQAPIIDGAIWNDRSYGSNILKSYTSSKGWQPLFTGYYHPVDTQQKPANPANGQMWVDRDNNDTLFCYDANTGTWVAVRALPANDTDAVISGFENFIHVYPHVPSIEAEDGDSYLVNNEYYGKLFDGEEYIHPTDEEYNRLSDTVIKYKDRYIDKQQSWIHVNAKNLYIIDKKFAQINKDMDSADPYGIDISPKNTEIYGFVKGTNRGQLLNYVRNNPLESDYSITSNGIKLNPKAYKYDYIYAISYGFINAKTFGRVVRGDALIKEDNQIYVGKFRKHPLVFLDGLYLEQNYYNYDPVEGVITLIHDKVQERMDMLAVIFPDIGQLENQPIEYAINQNNVTDNDALVGALSQNIMNFTKPVALVAGIMGGTPQVQITDEVVIDRDNNSALIKGIGSIIGDDEFKVMFVDLGDAHMSSGVVNENNAIVDENIAIEKDYLVFVEGLLISPRDYQIDPGEIHIHGLLPGLQYVLMEAGNKAGTGQKTKPYLIHNDDDYKKDELLIDNEGDNIQTLSNENIAVVCYDADVSYYTIRIDDGNENAIYNDCDTAVVFAGGGALIDDAAVTKNEVPKKGITGQIVKLKTMAQDGSFDYYYKQWDAQYNDWIEIKDKDFINEITKMITYFSTKGSISILNNRNLLNQKLTYYAYTYANSVDEPLLYGNRTLNIPVKDHVPPDQKNEFFTDFDHTFKPNVGSLSTYVNHLLTDNVEHELDDGGFIIPILEGPTLVDYKGKDHYPIFKSITNETTPEDLNMNYDEEFEKYISLKKAFDDFKNSELHYIVERVEEEELVACTKETIDASSRNEMYNNCFTTNLKLLPGVVNVYLNGILLEKNQYSILDEHNIILHFDVTGGHYNYDKNDPETWKTLMIPNDEGFYETFKCAQTDKITIEVREDYKLKRQTVIAKRGQYIFSVANDDLYNTIINSKDHVKIYIDGCLYTGAYRADIYSETITLLDSKIQNIISSDPIEHYFDLYPNEKIEYEKIHGRYEPKRSRITFEWR